MARIHVASADAETIRRLQGALEADGHDVVLVTDGPHGLDSAADAAAELIIIDAATPGFDGYRMLRRMREAGVDIPVLVLHTSDTEEDTVRALRLGADDYLTKPFVTGVLLARVEALLRRWRRRSRSAGETQQGGAMVEVVRFGDVEVSAAMRQVRINGEPVVLRPRELDLLLALIERSGRVVTRPELLQEVWGYDPAVTSRTVDIHVAELRRKLEADAAEPKHIITVSKRGYRFQA